MPPRLFPFAAQGKDVYNGHALSGTVTFDACGVSKAMHDCCTLPPPTCWSCDSSAGKCAADRAGSQTPDNCKCTAAPTAAPTKNKPSGSGAGPAVAGALLGCAALGASLWFYKNQHSHKDLGRNKHKYVVQQINEQGDAYVQMDSGGQLQ